MRIFAVACLAVAASANSSFAAGTEGVSRQLATASEAAGARVQYVYDYLPDVYPPNYLNEPWDGRHYFPTSGRRPKIGRKEIKPQAKPKRTKEATPYLRLWSNGHVFAKDVPATIAPDPNALQYMPQVLEVDPGRRHRVPRPR